MPSMNVSLTPELIKIVQSKVERGLYNNASEVIRDAIRQMDTSASLLYELKLARLREALAEGIADIESGNTVEFTLQDIIQELDEETRHEQ